MTARLSFDVVGVPIAQGSTQAFKRGGKVMTTNDPTGRIERWRGDVRQAAKAALPGGWEILTGPVVLVARFRFARSKSHFLPANSRRARPMLRDDAPIWHDQTPDLDKLLRAIGDALSHVVYLDDCQIVSFGGSDKRYADPGQQPGVAVEISERLP